MSTLVRETARGLFKAEYWVFSLRYSSFACSLLTLFTRATLC